MLSYYNTLPAKRKALPLAAGCLDIWPNLPYNTEKEDRRTENKQRKDDTSAGVSINAMEQPIIRLRPHHALCLRHYVGKGYDAAFVENMNALHQRLNNGERQMVQIILHRDSLCAACPHDVDYACETEDKVQLLDAAVADACGLRSGQWLSWQELCRLIDERMMPGGSMPEICRICEWYDTCAAQHA